ncbi:hypothetical protein QDA00_gp22 [Microbacterium phage Matzah]|uniref:Uncharacterized protein n=1 Tax=Microbacterium phage Matzah TaxID=2686228 RepID=A0A6B9LCQ8_9CAUD|nr:hypothetical protein QDA00_gp22 [Microbacterium phage Matzah]QHB37081.1 hypothetical protein SEA_MATZAH_88 [Microbacterium phage Matzah]
MRGPMTADERALIAEARAFRSGTAGNHLDTRLADALEARLNTPGRWYYGAVMSDPGETLEIASSGSAWHYEPYRTLEAVRDDWPDREYVRSWHPSAQDWEPVP